MGPFEWSGELITREEGIINDLDDWKIICEDIFLVDIGTKGYTDYETGKGAFKSADIIELYENYDGLLDGTLKCHHCHSHHSMQSFFSGTDWDNLEDRACNSNYFLMLIVNFDGKYCAKVAFKAKKDSGGTTINFVNNADGYKPMELKENANKEVLVVMDCKIEVEDNEIRLPEEFISRYEKVREIVTEENKKKTTVSQNKVHPKYQGGQQRELWEDGRDWNSDNSGNAMWDGDTYIPVNERDQWHWKNSIYQKKEKKISEMTDKEWNNSQQDGVGKWELRHAKALINSLLSDIPNPYEFKDCIEDIRIQSKKLKSKEQLEDYMTEFQFSCQESFDSLYPYKSVEDYRELMLVAMEYIRPYKHIRLANEIYKCFEDEAELINTVNKQE